MAITKNQKRKKRKTPINYRKKQNLKFFGTIAFLSALGFGAWLTFRYIKKSLPADPLNYYTLLQKGMQGKEVVELQKSLNVILKWYCNLYTPEFGPGEWNDYNIKLIPVNGKFDDNTEKAIRSIQDQGLLGGYNAQPKVQLLDVVNIENNLANINQVCPY